jgi:hypothetical protein
MLAYPNGRGILKSNPHRYGPLQPVFTEAWELARGVWLTE